MKLPDQSEQHGFWMLLFVLMIIVVIGVAVYPKDNLPVESDPPRNLPTATPTRGVGDEGNSILVLIQER